MRGRDGYAAVVSALVIVVVLGACSHGKSHASSPTAAPTTSTTATTTTTLPTTTSSTAPATTTVPATTPPTAAAPLAGCRSANLTLSVGPEGAAAGTQYFEIGFRNHASFPCVLTGYPGVSFLDASGAQIGPAAHRNNLAHGSVTVAPSAKVYAQVGVANPGVYDCTPVTPHDIRVYPPNETVAVLVHPPTGLGVCPTQGYPLVGPVVVHSNG